MAIKLTVAENDAVTLGLGAEESASLSAGSTTVVSINDYEELRNKPSIEGVELIGDVSLDDLGVSAIIQADLAEAKVICKI